jgi:hypothetical protein
VRSENLAVAAINATVLAVLVAGAAIYVGVIFQRVHELENQLLEGAARINDLNLGFRMGADVAVDYSGTDRESRRVMASELAHLMMPQVEVPGGPSARFRQIQQRISVLGHQFPFSSEMAEPPGPPVTVATREDVAKWSEAVLELVERPLYEFAHGELFLLDLIGAHVAQQRSERGAGRPDDIAPPEGWDERSDELNREMSTNMLTNANYFFFQASNIATEARNRIATLDAYRDRVVKRARPIEPAGWGALASFATGVLGPILCPSLPRWVPVSVPAAYYIALGVFGALWLRRQLGQSHG